MIVKDEAHVIERCLSSAIPYIDTWLICDTGSSDKTIEVVQDFMRAHQKPGEIAERPWRDFGYNRSEALRLARPKADYCLFLDADEELVVPASFEFPPLSADCYHMLHRHRESELTFWLPQLVRSALPFEYRGVLHEYLACKQTFATERLEGPQIVGWFDSARNRLSQEEKYERDAAVLEQALQTEPNNARYVFYLAQSYRDAKQPELALKHYRKRAQMGGWQEEVWYAQLQAAFLLEQLNRPSEALVAFLDAYQLRPQRAESLCALARLSRIAGKYHLAHLFAEKAVSLPQPNDLLFLDTGVYQWRARDELSISAYWSENYEQSRAIAAALLEEGVVPIEHRERIQRNLAFAVSKLNRD